MNDPSPTVLPLPQPAPVDIPTGHQIRTDRPCARCGFNLFGQTIVREPHYGLIAARCPECGQLAALQEYPALGKWADRWAKALAALWIIALVGAMAAQFGPTLGLTVAAMEHVFENAGSEITARYITWEQQQQAGPPAAQTNPGMFYGSWYTITEAWWEAERSRYIQDTGRVQPFNRLTITLYIVLAIISFTYGAFWSTVTLGARRWGAFVLPLFPVGMAAAFAWSISLPEPNVPGFLTGREAAAELYRVPIFLGAITVIGLALIPGVLLGRKLARLIVRLTLPPRMRGALAILWTRDGLPAPTAPPR
jgi:hypothetical protein